MKRPSAMQVLVGLLFLGVCVNTYVHVTSPAYRMYKEQLDLLRKQNSDYRNAVESNVYPALFACVSNMVKFVESGGSSAGVSVRSLPVVRVGNYSYSRARAGGYSDSGVYIDGNLYRLGDFYFGCPIISISPECCRTSDFLIVPDKSGGDNQKTYKLDDSVEKGVPDAV